MHRREGNVHISLCTYFIIGIGIGIFKGTHALHIPNFWDSARDKSKLRQMPEVFSSPLEDDIRRRANGGEKAVFAQRNPLTEMYPNAEYRNFEQEKTDECLEVSRQPSQPSAHILFCRACAGFMLSLARRSGSLDRAVSSRLMAARLESCPGSTPTIRMLPRRHEGRSTWKAPSAPGWRTTSWRSGLDSTSRRESSTDGSTSWHALRKWLELHLSAAAQAATWRRLRRWMLRNSSDTSPGTRTIQELIVSPLPLAVHHVSSVLSSCELWLAKGAVELWWVWWRLAGGGACWWLAAAAALRRSSTKHSRSFDLLVVRG